MDSVTTAKMSPKKPFLSKHRVNQCRRFGSRRVRHAQTEHTYTYHQPLELTHAPTTTITGCALFNRYIFALFRRCERKMRNDVKTYKTFIYFHLLPWTYDIEHQLMYSYAVSLRYLLRMFCSARVHVSQIDRYKCPTLKQRNTHTRTHANLCRNGQKKVDTIIIGSNYIVTYWRKRCGNENAYCPSQKCCRHPWPRCALDVNDSDRMHVVWDESA